MTAELTILAKDSLSDSPTFDRVRAIADGLLTFLRNPDIEAEIAKHHVLGGASTAIQAIILREATRLGFQSEKSGLFAEYPTSHLRPDYFLPVDHTGIILEVERGKTTTNNMDFLDLWKCHICKHASYLFLIVPHARPSANGTVLRHYQQVQKRLGSFFQPPNYVNVDAVFVFGY